MRILVECTYVFEHPDMKSGIQRVVRNVINSLPDSSSGVDVVPVAFVNSELFAVERLGAAGFECSVVLLRAKISSLKNRYWLAYTDIVSSDFFQKRKLFKKAFSVVGKFFSLLFLLPLFFIDSRLNRFWGGSRVSTLDVSDGDVLILLDSSWHSDVFSAVDSLKSRGVTIVSVVYDLIPLTHPEFCDEHLVRVFSRWFSWVTGAADGFVAISETIKEQLVERCSNDGSLTENRQVWFSNFYLGSDLDECASADTVRYGLSQVYELSDEVYLTVSTVEPRKNHVYQLDAFEQYWAAGGEASLCIVGKVGWKCHSLIERIVGHTEYNKRLFLFNDLSDDELEYCYLNAKALIFSSVVEGFGLPLVEASNKGLPVICSDIPVFREIGGDVFTYFDLSSVADLTEILLSGHVVLNGKVPCLTWPESTLALLSCVEQRLPS